MFFGYSFTFLFTNFDASFEIVFNVYSICLVLTSIIVVFLALKSIPKVIFESISVNDSFVYYKYCLPLMLTASVWILIRKVDLLMIKYFMSYENVAVYSIASQISSLPLILIAPGLAYLGPRISACAARKDYISLQRTLNKYNSWMSIFSISLGILVLFFTPFILHTLDNSFKGAFLPLIVLIIFQILTVLLGPSGLIIATVGKPYVSTISSIFILLTNVILNYYFVPIYGLLGAAISTGISLFMGYLILSIYINFKHKLYIFKFKL